MGGAINGLIYGTLLKDGEFGFHLKHGLGMALVDGIAGGIAGFAVAGAVPFAGWLVGRLARPIGVASQQLKDSMMAIANTPAFRARAELWQKLTGRGPIKWDKFVQKLEEAVYETNSGTAKGWAGLDASGKKLFFSVSEDIGVPGRSHELFHGLQEFMDEGLMSAAQNKTLGPFSILSIEMSANLYGNTATGLTIAGVGAVGGEAVIWGLVGPLLDYCMIIGEFD
jgi:hypothetical protein